MVRANKYFNTPTESSNNDPLGFIEILFLQV